MQTGRYTDLSDQLDGLLQTMRSAVTEHEICEAHKKLIRFQRSMEALQDEFGTTYQSMTALAHTVSNALPPPPQQIPPHYEDSHYMHNGGHWDEHVERMPNCIRDRQVA